MQTRVGISCILIAIGMAGLVASKVFYKEEFDRSWESRWQKSSSKSEQQGTFEWTKGKWAIESDSAYGLQTTTPSKFYYISSRLTTPVKTGESPFVLQYSLKFEENIECGGGYLKLLGTDYKSEEFDNVTPVLIMFGPDVCGSDNKIHMMLDFGGKGKLWTKKPTAPTDHKTHFYTMVINTDDTYAVYLDMELIGNGTISDDWEISVPKTIPDPNDKKPDDWDDRMYLDDNTSVKPDDWVDEEMIEDIEATKPEDWDDGKEGVWKHPMVKNPNYKGEWKPKKVYNTNYKGVWAPKKIPNPEYKGASLESYTIGGIGIDVWQVKSGTIFDNIMITDSLDEAFADAKKIIEGQVEEEKVFEEEEKKELEAKMKEQEEAMRANSEDEPEDPESMEREDL